MKTDIVARKVAQDVLMYVWNQQKELEEIPSAKLSFVPEISEELFNNLCISVWTDFYCNRFIWRKYFINHGRRMMQSRYLFANYVAYASYLFNKDVTDAYVSFYGTLSLIIYLVYHCWFNDRKAFFNSCVDLFCAFFEKEIRKKFEDQGSWQNFNEYLIEHHAGLKKGKKLISDNQPLSELSKELRAEHLEYENSYVIGGVFVTDITETQVETNEEATNFADSVLDQMRWVRKKSPVITVSDFQNVDNYLQTLYQQRVGKDSSVITHEEEQSLQKYKGESDVKANDGERSSVQKNEVSSLQKDEEFHVKAGEESSLQKDKEKSDAKAVEESLQKDEESDVKAGAEESSLQRDQKESDVKAKEGELSSSHRDKKDFDMKTSERRQKTSLEKARKEIQAKASHGKQFFSQKSQEAVFGKTKKLVQSTSEGVQEEVLELNRNKISSKKNEDQRDSLETLDLDSLKFQDVGPSPQEFHLNLKLTKAERTKILLDDMTNEFKKLYELIKLL